MRIRNSPSACHHCGAILDAPRVNPRTGIVARKCCDCERWQPLLRRPTVRVSEAPPAR